MYKEDYTKVIQAIVGIKPEQLEDILAEFLSGNGLADDFVTFLNLWRHSHRA